MRAHLPTCPTMALPASPIGVRVVVGVSLRAVRSRSQVGTLGGDPSPINVLLAGNRFKMGGVDAGSVATQMIQFQALRDRTHLLLPNVAMSDEMLARDLEPAVPLPARPHPLPTAGIPY